MFNLTLPFLYHVDVEMVLQCFILLVPVIIQNIVWCVLKYVEIRKQLPICANYISCSCIYLIQADFLGIVFHDYSCN